MAKSKRIATAQILAAATLAIASIYAANALTFSLPISVLTVFGLSAIAVSIAAFVVSLKQRSKVVAALLTASGIIVMIPPVSAIIATGIIVFPGPILGVISYSVVLGLGIAKGIGAVRAVSPAAAAR
jgi:hypothetical protein